MDSLDTGFDRVDTAVQLRQHTPAGMPGLNELLSLRHGHFRNQGIRIIRILQDSLDVRQEDKLLCLHGFRDRAGRVIRVDVEGIVSVV